MRLRLYCLDFNEVDSYFAISHLANNRQVEIRTYCTTQDHARLPLQLVPAAADYCTNSECEWGYRAIAEEGQLNRGVGDSSMLETPTPSREASPSFYASHRSGAFSLSNTPSRCNKPTMSRPRTFYRLFSTGCGSTLPSLNLRLRSAFACEYILAILLKSYLRGAYQLSALGHPQSEILQTFCFACCFKTSEFHRPVESPAFSSWVVLR